MIDRRPLAPPEGRRVSAVVVQLRRGEGRRRAELPGRGVHEPLLPAGAAGQVLERLRKLVGEGVPMVVVVVGQRQGQGEVQATALGRRGVVADVGDGRGHAAQAAGPDRAPQAPSRPEVHRNRLTGRDAFVTAKLETY